MVRAHRILFLMILSGPLVSLSHGQSSESDSPPENLIEWKLRYFSPEELADGTSDDTAIIADTGVANLLRYALGFGPRESIPALVSIQPAGDRLEVAFFTALDRSDVAWHLEGSTDLESWDSVEPDLDPESSHQRAPGMALATLARTDESYFFRIRVDRLIDDSDEDGLHDDRELAWFASVIHDPSDDPDQDGISTEDELRVGRSPHRGVLTDPDEVRAVTGLVVLTPIN